MWRRNTEDSPYLSETSCGVFALTLIFILVYLAFAWPIDAGVLYESRNDELWAIHSKRAIDSAPTEPLDDSTVVSLERTLCFGPCPEYRLRIFGSGKVEYYGYTYVCAFGPQTAQADTREVRRLVDAMTAAGYFGYSWREGPIATDSSSANTSLGYHGQSFEIHHYYGDLGAPKWLRSMETEIDRVAGSARWLPIPGKSWRRQCVTGDGELRDVTMDGPTSYSSWSTEPKIEMPRVRVPPLPRLLDSDR